jgi:ATP-dependent Zn protease
MIKGDDASYVKFLSESVSSFLKMYVKRNESYVPEIGTHQFQ